MLNYGPAFLVIAVLSQAAAAGLSAQAAPAVARDSAGVQIVRNAGASRALPVRMEARIGAEDGAPELMLYSVYSVAIDAKGTHYIGMEAEIRVFDANGRYVRTIGRRGKGPGEFGMPPFPIWFAGDSLIAMDRNLMRTTAFTMDGRVLATYNAHSHAGLEVRPLGRSDVSWIALVEPRIDFDDTDAVRRSNAHIRLRPGEVAELDPIELRRYYPRTDSLGATLYRIRNERIVGISDEPGFARRPFDDKPAYVVNNSGLVFAKVPGSYQIDVFDTRGRRVRSIRREFTPMPLSRADFTGLPQLLVDATLINAIMPAGARERQAEQMLKSMTARVDRLKTLPLPSHRSPVGRLLAAPGGMLWAERSDHNPPAVREALIMNNRLRVPSRWDVFDARGHYIGTADLPIGFRPLAVGDSGRVTGVLMTDDGVEYVATFSILLR